MLKITLITTILALFQFNSFAGDHAHVHGIAKISVAVEKNSMMIILDSPAEGIIGFEHKPKTKKEKAKLSTIKAAWLSNPMTFLGFTGVINCTFSDTSFKLNIDHGHGEIEAKTTASCKEKLADKEVTIDLKKKFKEIETIKVEVLRSNGKAASLKTSKKAIFKL